MESEYIERVQWARETIMIIYNSMSSADVGGKDDIGAEEWQLRIWETGNWEPHPEEYKCHGR